MLDLAKAIQKNLARVTPKAKGMAIRTSSATGWRWATRRPMARAMPRVIMRPKAKGSGSPRTMGSGSRLEKGRAIPTRLETVTLTDLATVIRTHSAKARLKDLAKAIQMRLAKAMVIRWR